MTERPDIDAQHLLTLLRERFLCRTDVVAFLAPWGKPCPGKVGDGLDALLVAHVQGSEAPKATVQYRNRRGQGAVSGHFRLGAYTPAQDGTTKWLCLDFDGGEHAEALADPKGNAVKVWRRFTDARIAVHLERSGGGKGWHLWCFFDPPLAAAKARAVARALMPEEVTLASGEITRTNTGRGIEVFPKQNKIGRTGYGNLVWLPWWFGAEGAANQFHRVTEDGCLVQYAPERLEAADGERIEELLRTRRAPASPRRRPADPPSDSTWRDWRAKALAALPLEAVYGEWLTGRQRETGWLECRDPWSPTGDRSPSAGVAAGTGKAERGEFHSFISGKTLSVFDFLVERGLAPDFAAARDRVAELSEVPVPKPRKQPAPAQRKMPRPQIRVNNRQLRDVITDAWQAVHAANRPPTLFRRSGGLARLVLDEGARIELADEATTYGLLARAADWVRVSEEAVVSVSPVRDVARDMLAYPDPTLSQLDSVVSAPVFGASGKLITQPGYHPEAQVWYQRDPGITVPPVPGRPSAAQLDAAGRLLLEELLVDFPFVSEADRAHAVAALLLPFVRRMVAGCTPIHLIEAPVPGSGKNLLADLVSLIATGRSCEPTTVTRDEDEVRKKITSLLAKAQPVILLDNVRVGIQSAQLASALTAEVWSDRLLGQNRMIDLPNHATWLVTANNPRLSLEIARRCVRIRMDPRTDRPWQRVGFRHSPLRDWVRQQRGELIHALLVLVQSWIAAGRPQGAETLGSFESYAGMMGGILATAGIPGFLGNAEELYEAADVEGNEWREFVAAWWGEHRDHWVSAKDLLELALERDMLGGVIGEKSLRSQQCRLGRGLMAVRDRQFAEWRVLMRHDAHSKSAAYRLVRVDPPEGPAGYRGMSRGISDPRYPASICDENGSRTDQADAAGYRGISESPSAHARAGAHARTHTGANPEKNPAISREGDSTSEKVSNYLDPSPENPAGYGPSISRDISRAYPASAEDRPLDLADLPDEEAQP